MNANPPDVHQSFCNCTECLYRRWRASVLRDREQPAEADEPAFEDEEETIG